MATGKLLYATPVDITIGLATGPLASSGTWVTGRESTAIDNTTNRYVDELVSGFISVGTTPTSNTVINVYVYAQTDDTPSYPSLGGATLMAGTDGNATFTSQEARMNAVRLGASIFVPAATSDVKYSIPPFSVASLFGGVMPRRWGIFVAHSTVAALNGTAGNHKIQRTPISYDIV